MAQNCIVVPFAVMKELCLVVRPDRAGQGTCKSNHKDNKVNLPHSPLVENQVYAAFFLVAVVLDLCILHVPSTTIWSEPAIKHCKRLKNISNI